ncbi:MULTISPECIES: leucine--tRNA ligase [Halococcus]|uniref:Leucine--tRNA ligase n=1 Tax=Halococcus salifodinae DSM 8989 TaxID=1227456 RepID=M0NFU2_9EURY|nr:MULTISPECIES: leucine--tRNA ligase [Halococcus]EMA55530.1 leucyl-tRNA ligase [Halococcus salifodinae DSM 8989]
MQQQDTYDHADVEQKWQARWEESDVFRISDDATDPSYVLSMFPYPSGDLHMGHVRNYTITDAYARYKRMQGESVLHPMGWDSFGLPAENAAIEREIDPREWTMDCIDTMRDQMQSIGFGIDWDREITTCEPEYYRWNQWLFKQFYEEGLAEQKGGEVNWCPSCETVLADEQVEGEAELCWRCDTPVETRTLDQWFLKITEYADDLLDGIDGLEQWPDNVRGMQRNWIGRQEGATVEFGTDYGPVEVFTTRLDTLYGATFFALAPDHEMTREIVADDPDLAAAVDELDPEADTDEKNGVFTGEYAINPATGEDIPIYVADFVLADVGTGALMGVPGHDERDHEFAAEYDIEIRQVVAPDDGGESDTAEVSEGAYTDDGVLIDSGEYDGVASGEAREQLIADLDTAAHHTQYRLRDWLISRQRYWGTPIPVVHCEECGPVMVPDEDLPVELPEFVPTPTGNPIEEVESFVETECPDCGGPAERETDTMDTFVDSSWYFLRFTSPDRADVPFDTERANDWLPVDEYVGGIEHAVMHLLYSRFVTRAIADMELLDVDEPFEHYLPQGMVQLDGTAMSSSTGNVVSPVEIMAEYGADTARLFMMGAARPAKDFDWTERGVRSSNEFIRRLFGTVEAFTDGDLSTTDAGDRPIDAYVAREIDATIAEATGGYEAFRFNEALREARGLVSLLGQYREYTTPDTATFERGLRTAVRLLAPVAPHVAEESWATLGNEGFVAEAAWPDPDGGVEDYAAERRLVENTREDVRDILDVAGIENPETIEVAVAPEWKHRALDVAIEADDDVVGTVMADEELRTHGEDAADYAKDLAANPQALSETLAPDHEYDALERASWLLDREFDATIVLERAAEAPDDLVSKARPGRPAIEIREG